MKIQFVVSGLGLGGAERQVVLLAREFARRGHGVGIYTLNRLLKRADELAGSGVELIAEQKRMRVDPMVIMRLRRQLKSARPDIVHSFLYDADIYARIAAIGLGVPVLSSERSDSYATSAVQRLGYMLTRSLSAGIVANSHAGAAFAAALHGQRPDRVHVVWNGINLDEIDRRLAKAASATTNAAIVAARGAGATGAAQQVWPGDGLRRALVVGSIGPAKDYPLALRTARAAVDRDPAWRFTCVGDALPNEGEGYKSMVLAEMQRLGLQQQVNFVGHRRDVPELMASSDVLLVTSVREGFPNVVLEAMACGTPVVSTDYSDVRRILPNAWQVVADRDAEALAAALVRCAAERGPVSAAQRQWVERFATIGASADSMLAAYERFVGSQTLVGAT